MSLRNFATLLGSACLLSTASGCGSEAPTGAVAGQVLDYDYQIDLSTRAARSTITVKVATEGDCFSLPFRAPEIAAATWNNQPATTMVEGGKLTLCGKGVEAGDTLTLSVDLAIAAATLKDSQVGFSSKKDRDGNDFTYLVSWVGGCDQFTPCDNRPDQFATYRFTITHAPTLKVRCSGVVTEVSPTETKCEFDHPGGPTYSTFGVVASSGWKTFAHPNWGPLRVTVLDRDATLINAAINDEREAGFINWMSSQFGAFPYGDELRILTGPTYWSGFEHPGNIVLSDNLARQRNPAYAAPVQHVLDHEIVHQWAGDQTTLADTYDFVWKEAMAEYLTYVYEDMTKPAGAKVSLFAWKSFSGNAKYFPVPTDRPALFDYYGDVYGPGPLVLFRQLEVMSSREKVLAAIKSVLGTPRSLSVQELVAALTEKTGLDLNEYVNAWIVGSGKPAWPRYQTVFTKGANAGAPGMLAVTLTNAALAGKKGCQFHVELRGAAETDRVLVAVDTFRGSLTQNMAVATPAFEVTSVVLDPLGECLVLPAPAAAAPEPQRQHPWLARD